MAPKRAAAASAAKTKTSKPASKTSKTSTATSTKANTGAKVTKKTTTKTSTKSKAKAASTTNGVTKTSTKRKATTTTKTSAASKKTNGTAKGKSNATAQVNGAATPEDTSSSESEQEMPKTKATKAQPKTKAAAMTNGTSKSKAGSKRRADDSEEDAPKPKKSKTTDVVVKKEAKAKAAPKPKAKKAKKVINTRASDKLDVFCFGGGEMAELGLGAEKGSTKVKRPRLNRNLDADTVGVVDVAVGGMHTIALTHDNQLLTWGVNDSGALARDTAWEGRMKDMDDNASDASDESDDVDLNPREATPGKIDLSLFPEDTVFTKVAASDNASFVLTDDGFVYGWGTFRSNDGVFGFSYEAVKQKKDKIQSKPMLISGLKNIIDIACGSNHVLALDDKGNIFAFGNGQLGQLGRRINERHQDAALVPTSVKIPKKKVVSIGAGSYHSYAIDTDHKVWAWGLNSYGDLGITNGVGDNSASVHVPTKVDSLADRDIAMIDAGSHHSAAITTDGKCLMFGRMDGGQIGIAKEQLPLDDAEKVLRAENGRAGALLVPTAIPDIEAAFVACGPDHTLLVSKQGKAYSWGFGGTWQLGLGNDEDAEVATLIDNTAVREKKLIWAGTGGQFSMLACKHV